MGRPGTRQSLSRMTYTVSQWMVSLPNSMSMPVHQVMSSDFSTELSFPHFAAALRCSTPTEQFEAAAAALRRSTSEEA
eukprot:1259733-Heterocapsa_arctica.AAC.1